MYIEIIVDSQPEADQVYRCAKQLIKKYDYLTVADLYDLVGQVGTSDDQERGWTSLDSIEFGRTVDGLSTTMTFPAPLPLDI